MMWKKCHHHKTCKKGKVTLFNIGSSFSCETGINGSRRCALYPPLPLSVLRFMGIQSYGYTDQRKVEANVEVTDLSLRKPHTSQLSHDCSFVVSLCLLSDNYIYNSISCQAVSFWYRVLFHLFEKSNNRIIIVTSHAKTYNNGFPLNG